MRSVQHFMHDDVRRGERVAWHRPADLSRKRFAQRREENAETAVKLSYVRRSELLQARVTPDELEAFDRVAKQRGLTRSALVRSLLHEAEPLNAVLTLPEIVPFSDDESGNVNSAA
jgi:hypothetical protein